MTTSVRVLGTLLLSICVGATALAQTVVPPAQRGQLTIERVEQGFVFAPDARVTEVNGETAALIGGYAGWMTDRTWMVGAGGYWLANQDDDLKMAYVGMVVEYLARSQERIGFGVRSLVGGGAPPWAARSASTPVLPCSSAAPNGSLSSYGLPGTSYEDAGLTPGGTRNS